MVVLQLFYLYFCSLLTVCWLFTLELMMLFVNRVFRISALWLISQIHEKAILAKKKKKKKIIIKDAQFNCNEFLLAGMTKTYQHWWYRLLCECACISSPHRSKLERREQRLELSSSGTISILWWKQNQNTTCKRGM